MKYLALISVAAFAIHPEMWVLYPAIAYIVLKVASGLFDQCMNRIANDCHKSWWENR